MTPTIPAKSEDLRAENAALREEIRELEARLHSLHNELAAPPEPQTITFRAWLRQAAKRLSQRLDGVLFGRNR